MSLSQYEKVRGRNVYTFNSDLVGLVGLSPIKDFKGFEIGPLCFITEIYCMLCTVSFKMISHFPDVMTPDLWLKHICLFPKLISIYCILAKRIY